jgi:transposase
MARGIPLRDDYTAGDLRALARRAKDAKQARRLLALSLICDGERRADAARHGGVDVQTIRDWVLRFNARGPDGLIDGKSTGAPPKLTAARKAALARVVEDGPTPYLHGVVRWRLSDLVAWLQGEFGVSLDESTVSRALRAMGYRKLSARPRHHAQDPAAAEAFKKSSPPAWRKSATPLPTARP